MKCHGSLGAVFLSMYHHNISFGFNNLPERRYCMEVSFLLNMIYDLVGIEVATAKSDASELSVCAWIAKPVHHSIETSDHDVSFYQSSPACKG